MPHGNTITKDSLIAIGAAERVLQAGGFVGIGDGTRSLALGAAEFAIEDVTLVKQLGDSAELVMSERMAIGGQRFPMAGPAVFRPAWPARRVAASSGAIEAGAVALLKQAGLLPAGVLVAPGRLPNRPLVDVTTQAIEAYPEAVEASLEIVVDAGVPLREASRARFVAFRSRLGGPQHYAVVVGAPERQEAPLCRLHSECFTGDIFASMRCDCGEQLHGAIQRMEAAGGGFLLYLSQEGRGIGLVNKLRAYRLQDDGLDTVDANTHLGFEPDERRFLCAARMLELLDGRRVRLLTNNPAKIEALSSRGIVVVNRVEHSFAANDHNQFYLETKAKKSGHMLSLLGLNGHGSA